MTKRTKYYVVKINTHNNLVLELNTFKASLTDNQHQTLKSITIKQISGIVSHQEISKEDYMNSNKKLGPQTEQQLTTSILSEKCWY